ncbi:MAG: YtxH domain-containing protein [Terriglobales bacterium]
MAESSKGLWFLLGLSAGALVGVLYAPQSGEETRDLISRKATEGRERAQRKAEDWRNSVQEGAGSFRDQAGRFREQASDYAGRGRQAINRQFDQFQAAVEAGKQAYRESAAADLKPEAKTSDSSQ